MCVILIEASGALSHLLTDKVHEGVSLSEGYDASQNSSLGKGPLEACLFSFGCLDSKAGEVHLGMYGEIIVLVLRLDIVFEVETPISFVLVHADYTRLKSERLGAAYMFYRWPASNRNRFPDVRKLRDGDETSPLLKI